MQGITQALLSGLFMGGVYSTIAVGLSLAFGVMRIVNWSHGESLMWAMYISYFLITFTKWDPYLVAILTALILFVYGYLIQKSFLNNILKREKEREPLSVLLFTAGLGMVLSNLALLLFGASPSMPATSYMGKTIRIGTLIISNVRFYSFIISLIATAALFVFLHKSEIGRAIRATAQNRNVAALMGINKNKIYNVAFAIGTGLVGLAGGLLILFYPVHPFVGQTFGTKSFIIVVLGGKGSVVGALLGGLIVGIVEAIAGQFITDAYAQAIVFVVFVIVLLFKPSGLLGKRSDIV